MLFSQAFQALILPAAVVPILVLINREAFMGDHRAGAAMNAGLTGALLFSLMTSYFAVAELMW